MFAVESNLESCKYAIENVERNNYASSITVLEQSESCDIFKKLLAFPEFQGAHFCMCNPPFFDKSEDLHVQNRTGKRCPAKNALSGCTDELSAEGGECQFVKKIIQESCHLQDRIRVYTTMLGLKSSVSKVLDMLKHYNITNVAKTEFCQGQTTRWAIAWSFLPNIALRTVPIQGQHIKKNKVYTFTVPNMKDVDKPVSIDDTFNKLERIFNGINLSITNVQKLSKNVIKFNVSALENTWSKQRRKRRELQRLNVPQFENQQNTERESLYECDDEQPATKKIKFEECDTTSALPILCMSVSICSRGKDLNTIVINLEYLSGVAQNDGVYQVLQFINNQWNKS